MPSEPDAKQTFGGCSFNRLSPEKASLSRTTKALNIVIGLDEALRLQLALQDGLLKLNRYKMSTVKGKRAAINFCVHLDVGRIQLLEGRA